MGYITWPGRRLRPSALSADQDPFRHKGDTAPAPTEAAATPDTDNDADVVNTSPKPSSAARRNPRRTGRHVVRAVAIDDNLGPLGPLGDNSNSSPEPSTPMASSSQEIPPQPPTKELGLRAGSSRLDRDILESVAHDEDGGEARRQQQQRSAGGGGAGGSTTEMQAAPTKPLFEIHVGDPHKVGDLTSAHTVYNVRTKVGPLRPLRRTR